MISTGTVFLNYVLGVLSSFSPCLFPLLPTYLVVVTKKGQSKLTTLYSTLGLILGVTIVFSLLGTIVNVSLKLFLLNNYVLFARTQAVMIILAGLVLLTHPTFLYKISLPQKMQNFLFDSEGRNPFIFSFVLGLLYTIIAAPCAGGYFFAVWASLINITVFEQTFLVMAFSLGAGTPFILASMIFTGENNTTAIRIRQSGNRISQIMGVILCLSGLYLLLDVI